MKTKRTFTYLSKRFKNYLTSYNHNREKSLKSVSLYIMDLQKLSDLIILFFNIY